MRSCSRRCWKSANPVAWIVKRKGKTGLRYYVRFSLHGRRYWFSAGKSRRVAELAKGKLETKIAEGRFLDQKRESNWTLGRLAPVYLDRMAKLRPKSDKWRRGMMKTILRTVGGETPLERVSLETIDHLVHELLAVGRSPNTVKAHVAVLRHAMKKASRWKGETGLSEYRLQDWEPLETSGSREPVFLTPAEVRRLFQEGRKRALAGDRHDREGEVALRLALATGARVSEIMALRWRNLEKRTGHLRLPTLKRGEKRGIALDDGTLRAVTGLWSRGAGLDDLLFPPTGKTASKDRYRDFWRAVRSAARVEHVRFHDLRHTFASEFLRRGGTVRELQRILGHKTSRMTERYAHFASSYVAPKSIAWRGAPTGATKGRKRTG